MKPVLYLKTEKDERQYKKDMAGVFAKIKSKNSPPPKVPFVARIKSKKNKLAKQAEQRVVKCQSMIKARKSVERSPFEKQIEIILMKNGVDFIPEHYAKEMFNKATDHLLYFDFYLPDYRAVIEYDGMQHFKPVYGEEQLKEQKKKDKIKNKFCYKHNILLLRIPYWKQDKIEEEIMAFFDKHF